MTKPSVFVAHSSLDTDDAHLVRNLLEDRKHDVLVLKLAQQMKDDDLEQLIREEIKARDWLVMLRSENAKNSRWVPFEEAYARFHRKPIFHVEQEKCAHLMRQERIECFEHQVRAISRDIRVFLSFIMQDKEAAETITLDLREKGYEVWRADELTKPGYILDAITEAIDEILLDGYMIVLISETSIVNPNIALEIGLALRNSERIIFCLIDPVTRTIPFAIEKFKLIDFRNRPYDHAFNQLLQALGWRP